MARASEERSVCSRGTQVELMLSPRALLWLGMPAAATALSVQIHQLRVEVRCGELAPPMSSVPLTLRCCVQMAGPHAAPEADDDVYYVNMQVGTPPQSFRVMLDTGAHPPPVWPCQ